ncbi:MAG: aminotransferase class IV [Verrucomicrobiota bacterium]
MSAPQSLTWLWNHNHFSAQANLPVSDRGFRYGMSVFESLRLCDGHLHFAEAHWARLRTAAQRCLFPLSESIFPHLPPLLKDLQGDWFIRLYVTAGDGSPTDPVVAPRVVLFAEQRVRIPATKHHIALSEPPFRPLYGGIKTGNYWENVKALTFAKTQTATETLLFNSLEQLVSASMANVFLRIDGRWITPSINTECRNGVVRSWVQGRFAVIESTVSKEDVLRAESGFLTNSWMGIGVIETIEKRPLTPDPEVAALEAQFEGIASH